MVECQLPKLEVAGSNPVFRSKDFKGLLQIGSLFLFWAHARIVAALPLRPVFACPWQIGNEQAALPGRYVP